MATIRIDDELKKEADEMFDENCRPTLIEWKRKPIWMLNYQTTKRFDKDVKKID